jgi:hypothetical protein
MDGILSFGGLSFRCLDVGDRSPIAGDLPDDSCRGIYVYDFGDGMWYVGKSEDVRVR